MLLQSWSYNKFIADGWLSLYDYMSVKADSLDQQMVFGLTKRGADGDFSLREMSEKLDVRPSIERLCEQEVCFREALEGIRPEANHVDSRRSIVPVGRLKPIIYYVREK